MKSRLSPRVAWLVFAAIDLSILALVVAIGFQVGSEPSSSQLKVTVDGAP